MLAEQQAANGEVQAVYVYVSSEIRVKRYWQPSESQPKTVEKCVVLNYGTPDSCISIPAAAESESTSGTLDFSVPIA